MRQLFYIFKLVFLSFILGFPYSGHAQLGKFISPGDLAEPHKEYEGLKNCTLCHVTGAGTPDRKCLDCHKEIDARLAQNKGFHARQKDECIKCHSDHKGRKYDLTGLSRIKFDHDETGWPLEAKHIPVKCEDCHSQKRKHATSGKITARTTYLGASDKCVSCHTDIHNAKKSAFKACENCHNAQAWKPMIRRPKFDHNQQTNYSLTGAHNKVSCYSCHTRKLWAPLAFAKCTDCHKDPHQGKFGAGCTDCHSTATWKTDAPAGSLTTTNLGDFDHQKTRFPLLGQHRRVDCKTCHGPVIGPVQKFAQCGDCHNNPHRDQFAKLWQAKQCTDCHLFDGWQILNFQHDKDSRYKLEDQHLLVPCASCHIDRQYRWLNTTPDCAACHLDVHNNQFVGKPCATCHNTKSFNLLNFDHNQHARFALVGKHALVDCEKCHPNGKYKPIDTYCGSCHNDFHNGELGTDCVRCHSPRAFNEVEFNHNRDARFPLAGQHAKVNCNTCHLNYKYKIGLTRCGDCHQDVHNGSFGPNCERCHDTSSFRVTTGFHDFGEYSLGGIHDRLNCLVCHAPKASIRPTPTQCSSCHRDVHMNSFGNRCQECHNQMSWLPSTFRHQKTGFELSGAHRFVSCERCHVNRVFGGLPSECTFCHLKDFVPASLVPEHGQGVSTCETCHRTFGWRPAR